MAKCIVGAWAAGLDADSANLFTQAAATKSRVETLQIAREQLGAVYALTALKDHLNSKCACTKVDETTRTFQAVSNGEQKRKFSIVLDRPIEDVDDILELGGHDPARFQVVGEVTLSHRELADGRCMTSCSYKIRERATPVDLEPVLAAPAHTEVGAGEEIFCFHSPDLQIGKVASGGGTAEMVARYRDSLNLAAAEMDALTSSGRRFGGVLLAFAGDVCEGWHSQGGKNIFLTSETMAEQMRIYRRLLTEAINVFAPKADHLTVAVCGGNHDTLQRTQNTPPGDNMATESAIAVQEALAMNPAAYGHVEILVPDKWRAHMTFRVGDSVVAMTHGDLFREGRGMQWWSEQSFGKNGSESADVLLTGHYHNFRVETSSGRTWIQGSTMDGGSDWYQDRRGCWSERGAVVFTMRGGKVANLGLV